MLHYRKEDMRAHAGELGHEVFASVDHMRRDGKTVSQRFLSFASHALFIEHILETPAERRCFYEMVRDGQPCKLYFDVEWTAADSTATEDISAVRDVIARAFAQLRGREIGPCVQLDGCRQTPKGYKHSYHLVYTTQVFARNNGLMKHTVESVARAVEAAFPSRPCIDCAVYTRDRAFRTALSHKLSDASRAALRWQAQPADEHELRQWLLESMVTACTAADVTHEEPMVVVAPAAVPRGRAPSRRNAAETTSSNNELQGALQRWLARRGGLGRVGGCVVATNGRGGVCFRYSHSEPGREEPCLAHGPFSTVTHKCDNQFVCIDSDSYVKVVCPHGAKCSKRYFNFGRLMWRGQPVMETPLCQNHGDAYA